MTTNKRFTFMQDTLVKADVFDNGEFVCCTLSVWVEQLVDLLNELHEENEQSKMMIATLRNIVLDQEDLEKENQQLKKQLGREETDKKRLMSYLMRYKGFAFDEIVEDFLDEPYYDNWWEDGVYDCCWDEYLKEKGFDGCDD